MAFWSTTGGVVTGVAGTLTGVVGIATLAAQMGWIGSEGGGAGRDSAATTAAGSELAEDTDGRIGESGARPGGDDGTAAPPEFAVAPGAVRFEALGSRTASVTVRNTGDVELRVDDLTVDGADEDRFSVAASACTSSTIDPGRSCEVEVSVTPEGGAARATMVVEVAGAPAREVPLTAVALL